MIFPIGKKREDKSVNPNHIAMSASGISRFAKENKIDINESWKKSFERMKDIIRFQVQEDIPIFTFNLLPSETISSENFADSADFIAGMLDELRIWDLISEKKIKISVIGKWYELPSSLVDSIKRITRETRDYDSFFVNICANYDGHTEISDAFRVVAMKIKNGSLDPDAITEQDIKENIYSSYFIPPDIIIINGGMQSTKGFLLWDSKYSKIYFTDKLWPEMKPEHISRIIQKVFRQ